MKVINKKPKADQVECDCGVLLEYTTEDIMTGAFGCPYIICPECNERMYIENDMYKEITIDNINFPQDFTDPNESVDIEDGKITEWIKRCVDTLEKDSEDYGVSCEIGMGNAMVFVRKFEDEYHVWVARNYYESSILRS